MGAVGVSRRNACERHSLEGSFLTAPKQGIKAMEILTDMRSGATGLSRRRLLWQTVGLAALVLGVGSARAADKAVTVMQTPDDGIQPQAVVDARGALHLLYYKGKPIGGDLFYVRREPAKERFSEPIAVNSMAGSAIAMGSIRGGQLAVGKGGRVHVAWNGTTRTTPKDAPTGTPLFYARLNDAGTAFEPQRNLMQGSFGLDGGGTVAADGDGSVVVAWHGLKLGGESGEENRQVWVARSTDEGKTFAAEKPAAAKATGACGCCGMRGFADAKGNFYFLYRAAGEKIHRDTYLLTSGDHGKSFEATRLHPWELMACPMSSEAFAEGPNGVTAAWETDGQVYSARVDAAKPEAGKPAAPPGAARGRKHPALTFNGKGEMILVWTEGTGWDRGGALVWQVYDNAGKPTGEKGRIDNGIPVWGLPAVVARADGTFLIFH
jgi:hypothetical protein